MNATPLATSALALGQRPTGPHSRRLAHVSAGNRPTDLLFQGQQEVLIGHNGETYRLRITRNGKLILTK